VRGWFVRKNYINLREAARIIQVAFREKKRALQLKGLSIKGNIDDDNDDENKTILNIDCYANTTTSTASSNITSTLNQQHPLLDEVELTYSHDDYDNNYNNKKKKGILHLKNDKFYNYDINNNNYNNNNKIHHNTNSIDINDNYNIINMNLGDEKKLQAAATLQAITRGMIARKAFNSIRKHTTASIVIQKTLVKWWIQKNNLNSHNVNNFFCDNHSHYYDNHDDRNL